MSAKRQKKQMGPTELVLLESGEGEFRHLEEPRGRRTG